VIKLSRKLCAGAAALAVAAVVGGTTSAVAAPVARPGAVRTQDADPRLAPAVFYADTHWSWTAWNDPTPVPAGTGQEKFQCAEFVARALAASGLVPGLTPYSSQDDYYHYTYPVTGKRYDLLLISDVQGYNNIYDYLMDTGLGQDIGDRPDQAEPGDVVVTYLGPGGTKSHTGLIATEPDGAQEATVDGHNNARYHYGLHFFAPLHIVKINPDAVFFWPRTRRTSARSGQIPPARPHMDPAPPQV
jgi:hypothetical protein